jgi:hypothetical protein
VTRPLSPDLEQLYALALSSLPAGFLPGTRQPAGTLPGVTVAPAVPEACAVELARRTGRRDNLPAGGLFDETAIRQTDLFDHCAVNPPTDDRAGWIRMIGEH